MEVGEVVAILGRNGMGKTTLLKSIMGMVSPTTGSISILGNRSEANEKPFQIARLGVSYIAQERALYGDLTVEENIALALPRSVTVAIAFERIAELFPKLATRRVQLAGTLSGGEQKMLLLARGLALRPRILLIDEVTEGLQPSVREILKVALKRDIADHGTTILLVEQDLRFAFALADRFLVMKLGRFVAEGQTAGQDWNRVAVEHLAV
jgi:branched-chain amino acid transport system ATP-binding protein